MSEPFDAEAHARHMARALDLPIDPAWMPSVVATLARTAEIGGAVLEFPLDDRVEPAPVFEA